MVLPSLLQSALLAALLQGSLQIPAPVGLVNDFAHVIPAANAAQIEQIANDVRTKSRGEIAVVTLSDIGDRAPSDVALQIGRQWKVGKIGNPGDPTRNAGAVILLVPKETSSDGKGHCWISTGSGAEGFITDADAGDMCREATPFFRDKNYGEGLVLLTYLTAQRFASEFHFTVDTTFAPPQPAMTTAPTSAPSDSGGFPPQLIFLAIVFIFLFLGSMRRGRRGGCGGCFPIFLPFGGGGFGGGGWGGGGFGGGGGGGGFGGFGGGGGFSGGGGGSSW